jgi:tetratricopeptide (TPR) repeat protein
MFKSLAHSWRKWWQAGVVVSLVTCLVTTVSANDLSAIGTADRPGSPPDQALVDATLPIEPDAGNENQSVESLPMYRLPAVEESDVAADVPADAAVEEIPAEVEMPTITILPPIDQPALPALAAPLPKAELVAPTAPSAGPIEAPLKPAEEAPPEADAPTITILPPVDSPLPPVAEISRLPAPTELAGPTEPIAPAQQAPATEAAEEIAEDFDTAWNESSQIVAVDEPPVAVAQSAPPAVEPQRFTPYAPTTAELSRQLLPTVRRAFGLAQHGAAYAAQTEFIRVLRRIAESKDAAEGIDTHSRALAAGMRALDEADDFAPKGSELEADVNVAVIASAHHTPVLAGEFTTSRPAEAIALYHQFARVQLAQAVAGEQAGSMALYGLGKVNNRLARDADGELQQERKALVMFLAALDAGPGNHLAANEIGVLLSRAGQPAAASEMFRRAIDIAPTSTGYHNLAVTDRALGFHQQADANERYAMQLAQLDRTTGATSRAKGVQWVAPQELSRVAQPMPIENNNYRTTSAPPAMLRPVGGEVETASKWPQKLVPGIFHR